MLGMALWREQARGVVEAVAAAEAEVEGEAAAEVVVNPGSCTRRGPRRARGTLEVGVGWRQ